MPKGEHRLGMASDLRRLVDRFRIEGVVGSLVLGRRSSQRRRSLSALLERVVGLDEALVLELAALVAGGFQGAQVGQAEGLGPADRPHEPPMRSSARAKASANAARCGGRHRPRRSAPGVDRPGSAVVVTAAGSVESQQVAGRRPPWPAPGCGAYEGLRHERRDAGLGRAWLRSPLGYDTRSLADSCSALWSALRCSSCSDSTRAGSTTLSSLLPFLAWRCGSLQARSWSPFLETTTHVAGLTGVDVGVDVDAAVLVEHGHPRWEPVAVVLYDRRSLGRQVLGDGRPVEVGAVVLGGASSCSGALMLKTDLLCSWAMAREGVGVPGRHLLPELRTRVRSPSPAPL